SAWVPARGRTPSRAGHGSEGFLSDAPGASVSPPPLRPGRAGYRAPYVGLDGLDSLDGLCAEGCQRAALRPPDTPRAPCPGLDSLDGFGAQRVAGAPRYTHNSRLLSLAALFCGPTPYRAETVQTVQTSPLRRQTRKGTAYLYRAETVQTVQTVQAGGAPARH